METRRESRHRPRTRITALLAAAAIALLGLPGAAAAHGTDSIPEGPSMNSVPGPAPASVQAVAGTGTESLANGLYRVTPALGDPLLTHGPDTRAATESRAGGVAPDGTGFVAGAVERPPVCASDYYQQVIYASLALNPDRIAAASVEIREVVGRMDAVLNSESLASGGPGADYKLLCDEAGQVRVDALTVPGASFAEVVSAARAAGFASDQASYLIFVDGALGASCGIASYEDDERLAIDNLSNSGGGYAVVYEPCWKGETAMHESAHMMGAVQYGAPNSTGTGGHCNEAADVLCYSPDGGDLHQTALVPRCPGVPRFDCNFDDYFDAAPEPGEYLASHWNLGSPLNRFISFGTRPAPPGKPPAGKLGRRGKQRATAGERGDWRQFKVRVRPGSANLRARLFADPGADLGIFLRRAKEPTRAVFNCRAVVQHRHAGCRVDDPQPGIWYIGVLTRGGPPGAGYQISARAQR